MVRHFCHKIFEIGGFHVVEGDALVGLLYFRDGGLHIFFDGVEGADEVEAVFLELLGFFPEVVVGGVDFFFLFGSLEGVLVDVEVFGEGVGEVPDECVVLVEGLQDRLRERPAALLNIIHRQYQTIDYFVMIDWIKAGEG